MIDFGERLKALRTQKGWSQRELARRINRSANIVWRLEANLQQPTLDILLSFAALFNVSLDYLGGLKDKRDLSPEQEKTLSLLAKSFSEMSSMSKENRLAIYCEIQKLLVNDFLE